MLICYDTIQFYGQNINIMFCYVRFFFNLQSKNIPVMRLIENVKSIFHQGSVQMNIKYALDIYSKYPCGI